MARPKIITRAVLRMFATVFAQYSVTLHLRSPGLEADSDLIFSEGPLKRLFFFFSLRRKRRNLTCVLPEFCGQLSPRFGNSLRCCRQRVYRSVLRFHFPTGHERNLIRGQLMPLKVPQHSAKHRELSASPPNILDNAVLQIPRLFRHRHCLGQ